MPPGGVLLNSFDDVTKFFFARARAHELFQTFEIFCFAKSLPNALRFRFGEFHALPRELVGTKFGETEVILNILRLIKTNLQYQWCTVIDNGHVLD